MKFTRFNADTYTPFAEKAGAVSADLFGADMPGFEKQTFEEHIADVFFEDIKNFIGVTRSADEYKEFVTYMFKNALGCGSNDPVWKLLEHIEQETDFYTAPASTRFHGSEECGLIRHSLLVAANGVRLAPAMLYGDIDMYYLIVSCVFHDICKTNMYEIKMRNAKNEKTGLWEKVPFFSVKESYLAYGHGIESVLRLNKFITMPDSWNHAIRWHMGAYDISPTDKLSLDKALAAYREVLLLQTADMLAGLVDRV